MLGSAPLGSEQLGGSDNLNKTDYFEEISLYLPLESKNIQESDYLTRHIQAFTDNQHKNNDYALLALHQLFMFITYGLLFSFLRRETTDTVGIFALTPVRPEEKQQLTEISSLFALSLVNERSIFDLMTTAGCEVGIGYKHFKQIVNNRNDLAHCNGKICISFDEDIHKYLEALEDLHVKFAPVTGEYLLDINNIDFENTDDVQRDEFISILSDNYVSLRMMEVLKMKIVSSLNKNALALVQNYLGS